MMDDKKSFFQQPISEVYRKSLTVMKTRLENSIDIYPIRAVKIDNEKKLLTLSDGLKLEFERLLLCTGATPRNIGFESSFCLSLRDTASALKLSEKMKNSKRVVIVGNGGIALELVHRNNARKIL